jgi:hypothetical protein
MKTRLPLLAASLLAGALSLNAQVGRPNAKVADFDNSYTLTFNSGGDADLERGSTKLGELSYRSARFSWQGTSPWGESGMSVVYGVTVEQFWLSPDDTLPLPEDLGSVAAVLGLRMPLSQQWILSATLRPGVYSDFEDTGTRDLNVPTLLTATYLQSRELAWVFGLNVNFFNENPVLPALGVRWQFDPNWTLTVGYPRTGIGYKATERLNLGVGATAEGGSFHVGQRLAPGIRRTLLDFTEFRVGASASYKITETFSATVDLGWVARREFDYFDKNWSVDGSGGLAFGIALEGKF